MCDERLEMQRLTIKSSKPWTHHERGAERPGGFVEFNKGFHFINNLPMEVYVRDRTDMLTTIPPAQVHSAHKPDVLIVRQSISCSLTNKKAYVQEARLLAEEDRSLAQKAVVDQWTNASFVEQRGSVNYECSVDSKEFELAGGVIYLEDFDVLVFYGPYAKKISESFFHPYSKRGAAMQRASETGASVSSADFSFNIQIVDNTGTIGPRWMKIADRVIGVQPVINTDRRDGFYVTYRNTAIASASDEQYLMVSYYDADAEGNIPFFRTYKTKIEAINSLPQTELEELELKRRDIESKLERARLEAEATAVRHAHELRKLAQENEKLMGERDLWIEKQKSEKLKASAEQAKAKLDETTNRRKNTAELFKYVPIVLGLIATLSAKMAKAN